MGGPGSSKTEKMEDIAAQHPEWRLINASTLVWDYLRKEFPNGLDDKAVGEEAEMSGREITANMVRKVVKKGEMVPQVGDISRLIGGCDIILSNECVCGVIEPICMCVVVV